MARPPKQPDIYEANDSFSTAAQEGDYWFTVQKGQTFEADHWIVKKYPHLFRILQARHQAPVEQATDAPGELRGE